MRAFVLLAAVCIAGCGDDDASDASIPDAVGLVDMADNSDAGADGGGDAGDASADAALVDALADAAQIDAVLVDVEPMDTGLADALLDAAMDVADAGSDAGDAGFGMSCTGACAVTDLEAAFGAAREPFDVAYFGFNGDGSLHVEAFGGASEGCPQMDSPSPDRTLILGVLPVPTDRNELTLTASLLDFEGTLTDAPFLSAQARIRPASALLTPLEDAFVRVDLEADFEGGSVSGSLYATHCTSLDE